MQVHKKRLLEWMTGDPDADPPSAPLALLYYFSLKHSFASVTSFLIYLLFSLNKSSVVAMGFLGFPLLL